MLLLGDDGTVCVSVRVCMRGKVDVTNSSFSLCLPMRQNNIPVFCPALTDGSLGDMLYLHTYKNPGLKVDIVEGNCCIANMYVEKGMTSSVGRICVCL